MTKFLSENSGVVDEREWKGWDEEKQEIIYEPVRVRKVLSFRKAIPYEGEWDYDWCVDNWGTKWDLGTDTKISLTDEDQPTKLYSGQEVYTLEYIFETAWAPPLKWLHKVAKKYPNLCFDLLYSEPGMNFEGQIIIMGDERLFETETLAELSYRTIMAKGITDLDAGLYFYEMRLASVAGNS